MQPRGMDALARRHGFWLVALLALMGIGLALGRASPALAEPDLAGRWASAVAQDPGQRCW